MCNQFFRPRTTGRVAFSARLVLSSNSGYSKKRVSFFHTASVYWHALLRTLEGKAADCALVADDSELVRHGIGRLLERHQDWKVCGEAVDGQEAIEKAHQLAPDVVVLDFAMPIRNGVEAARQILKEHPGMAIVLCSMYSDHQLASAANRVGITSVLSKSNMGKLIKGVETALRQEPFSESRI